MTTTVQLERREFLHLAHTYKPNKPPKGGYDFNGWYLSEKLDGGRCFWDGGLTRGMNTKDVPWAGVLDPKKPGKLKKKIKPVATGLWSRYGNPVMAPDWFLNGLPCMPLDGELFAGRGKFQRTMSVIRKDAPVDSEWEGIQYAVYGSPSFETIFRDGEIKNSNMHCTIKCDELMAWIKVKAATVFADNDFHRSLETFTFENELNMLLDSLEDYTDFAYLHKQVKLTGDHESNVNFIESELIKILDLGGEGLILRNSESIWIPKRSHDMLKYKPFDDDEGTVVGFTSGRKTDKGSKLLGMVGAIILNYKGKRLEIAGLNNKERTLALNADIEYARSHPGEDMPFTKSARFKVGDTVTFRYRELSDDGIPKDARYLRPRQEQ